MTQTLRRELKLKFRSVLGNNFPFENGMSDEVLNRVADELTDSALSVAGIINSPVGRKYSDPNWDILHGISDSEGENWASIYTSIAEKLEKGLLRNEFPQTYEAQKVYKWIYEQEKKGEKLDAWIKWAMDGNRANYSYVYHTNPNFIKRDWVQAFQKTAPSGQRKFERLNND